MLKAYKHKQYTTGLLANELPSHRDDLGFSLK